MAQIGDPPVWRYFSETERAQTATLLRIAAALEKIAERKPAPRVLVVAMPVSPDVDPEGLQSFIKQFQYQLERAFEESED